MYSREVMRRMLLKESARDLLTRVGRGLSKDSFRREQVKKVDDILRGLHEDSR